MSTTYQDELTAKHIPIDQCVNRKLYRVVSRNLNVVAVYSERSKGFLGIRTKWGSRFVEVEYHWDTGAPHGTCHPMEAIDEMLPIHIEPTNVDNNLFEWLVQMEDKYGPKEY